MFGIANGRMKMLDRWNIKNRPRDDLVTFPHTAESIDSEYCTGEKSWDCFTTTLAEISWWIIQVNKMLTNEDVSLMLSFRNSMDTLH